MPMKQPKIFDIELVREHLDYCPSTGIFTWKTHGRGRVVGEPAGTIMRKGYRRLKINGAILLAHRAAWALTHGYCPALEIDHINGIKDDNRIDNLRLATAAQNQQNSGRSRANKSGYKGVSKTAWNNKWQAKIYCERTRTHLGYFESREAAAEAYRKAAEVLHGEFANAV